MMSSRLALVLFLGPFYDGYSYSLEEGYRKWPKAQARAFVMEQIRHYRPDVVVSHDEMCIRDSFHVVDVEGADGVTALVSLFEHFPGVDHGHGYLLLTTCSVSYTHLDVYKRQDRQLFETALLENVDYAVLGMDEDSVRSFADETILFLTDAQDSWEPVSYTHLDVYKRQG